MSGGGFAEILGQRAASLKHTETKEKERSKAPPLVMSPEEVATIQRWLGATSSTTTSASASASASATPSLSDPFVAITNSTKPRKVIFDTDLGSDVDDSLALLALLHFPKEDVELLGITTVYGCTKLRAKLCELIVSGAKLPNSVAARKPNSIGFNCASAPVIAGAATGIRSGFETTWYTSTEGVTRDMLLLSKTEVEELRTEDPSTQTSAADFIASQVNQYPGEVTLICIGAMTNVAIAVKKQPDLAGKIKHIVFMAQGGRMHDDVPTKWAEIYFPIPKRAAPITPGMCFSFYPDHNIKQDLESASFVCETGIPMSFINTTVTTKNWFTGPKCEELLRFGDSATTKPFTDAEVVGLLLREWFEYRSGIFRTRINGTCPHDPLTTYEAVYPGSFVTYAQGHICMHRHAGYSSFVLDPTGPHRIGVTVNSEGFLEALGNSLV
ncbi:purine nucleosidase [Pelomyxa schiedti]|nr:purine nucleosidase [Pelomyxa schiedti]